MKKILVIGAGFLQSFLIQRAKELKYTVLAVDKNPSAIGFLYADKYAIIDIVDQKACLNFAKQEKIDGVITAASDYGVLTTAYIAKELNLPGLTYSVAEIIKNKYLTRQCLFENKIDDMKEFYLIENIVDLINIKNKIQYPIIIKPCDGSGSRGVIKVNAADELESAYQQAIIFSNTKKLEIETFIQGVEYGVESFVYNNNIQILSVIKKQMTAPPAYAELGHILPAGLTDDMENKIKTCVINAITALKINFGAVNMDILITPDNKIYIIDIGARMGGNIIGSYIIPNGTGIDYIGNLIRASVNDEIIQDKKDSYCVATKIIAFPDNKIINQIPDIKQLENQYKVTIYLNCITGQQVYQYHNNLDGCGYIAAKAKNINEAIYNAEMAYNKLLNLMLEENSNEQNEKSKYS